MAALVNADIVDSTRTMAALGVATALEHRQQLSLLIGDLVGELGGETIAAEGDGSTIGFASTVTAVAAAQRLVETVDAGHEFDIRVGVSLGDGAEADLDRVDRVARCAEPNAFEVDALAQAALVGAGDDRTGPLTELRAVMFAEVSDATPAAADEVLGVSSGVVVDSSRGGKVFHFESCTAAVASAQLMRSTLADLRLRAGGSTATLAIAIAVGEIAVDRADEFGPPVVEAARLLPMAADTTVMSESVRMLAQVDHVESLGRHALKGLPFPVDVAALTTPARALPISPLPPAFQRAQRFGFAGRRADFDQLRATWRAAVAGGAHGAIVSGEEGAGKTRLVREVARAAHDEGGLVLLGSCDEQLRVPYGPVASALRSIAELDGELAAAIGGDDSSMASLFDRPRASRDERSVRLDRLDLFDAVAATLGRLARRRPVLLVIDDMQWATPETVRLVEHVLAAETNDRVMVLGTCRMEAIDAEHPIRSLLASSRPARRITHQRLDRMSPTDVAEMLRSRAGVNDGPALRSFVAEVTRLTGGNPLFVEELMVHFATSGILANGEEWSLTLNVDELDVPDSVVELMSRRLLRLGADAVDVLTTAAVIGTSFEAEILARVAKRDDDEVLDVIDLAADAGLIDDDGETCRFGDEIVRAALLADLRSGRRARVHRHVAEVLEQERPTHIDALAHHWDRARGDDARTRAMHYYERTIERDISAVAWESAVERLRRLTTLLRADEPADEHRLGEAHYRLGYCLRMTGDEAHRPDLLTAAAIARTLGDADLLARCATAMMRPGSWYPEAGVVDTDIAEMCDDALTLLADDDPLRPRVLSALAVTLAYDGDHERRHALVNEAQRLAATSEDRQLIGTTIAAELISSQEPDRADRRLALATELRAIGRSIGDRDLRFTGGFFVMLEHIVRGDISTATSVAVELDELAEASRAYWPRFLVAHFATLVAIATCDPEVDRIIEAERDEFQQYPVDWSGISIIQQAAVAMTRGTTSDMLLPIAAVMDDWSDVDGWAKKWNYAFAKAYLDAGDLEAAERAIEANPDPDFDRYWLASVHHLGLLGLALGRRDYCARVLELLGPYRGRWAVVGVGACITGQVTTALGQAALGLGDLEDAEELFREAVADADLLGFPFFATTARRFLATTLLHRDSTSGEVAELLTAVEEASTKHGFALEAAAAAELRAGSQVERNST